MWIRTFIARVVLKMLGITFAEVDLDSVLKELSAYKGEVKFLKTELEKSKKLLDKKTMITELAVPPRLKRITNTDLKRKLQRLFPSACIHLSDKDYGLASVEDLKRFLKLDPTDKHGYVEVEHDCDDYSYTLLGASTRWCPDLCFGLVWGVVPGIGLHAFNIYINQTGQVYSVEPQTDKIVPMAKRLEGADVRVVVI